MQGEFFASSRRPTTHCAMTTRTGRRADQAARILTEYTHTLLLQMSMIWNTDPVGHCLVFPSLQITKSTVVFYLVASESARTSCHRSQPLLNPRYSQSSSSVSPPNGCASRSPPLTATSAPTYVEAAATPSDQEGEVQRPYWVGMVFRGSTRPRR